MHCLSEKVQRVLKAEGISKEELEDMLQQAAITRLRGHNRRFLDWLFTVNGSDVVDMVCLNTVTIGKGPEKMRETCSHCGGKGCQKCGWYGYIFRRISNPAR